MKWFVLTNEFIYTAVHKLLIYGITVYFNNLYNSILVVTLRLIRKTLASSTF